MLVEQDQSVVVFFSYEKRDKRLRDRLEDHLSDLKYRGLITTWHDRQILASEDRRQQIDLSLEKAQIILLLISANFMASDYCYGQEMQRALLLHDQKRAAVVPVLLRPVLAKNAPFSRLASLPTNGKPITQWRDRDSAFVDIAENIEKIVKQYRQDKQAQQNPFTRLSQPWNSIVAYQPFGSLQNDPSAFPFQPGGMETDPFQPGNTEIVPPDNPSPARRSFASVLLSSLRKRGRSIVLALLAAIVLLTSILLSFRMAYKPVPPSPPPSAIATTVIARATATAALKSGPINTNLPLLVVGVPALLLLLLLLLGIALRRRNRLRREAQERALAEEARKQAEARALVEEALGQQMAEAFEQKENLRKLDAERKRKHAYYLKSVNTYQLAASKNPEDGLVWRGLGNSYYALANYSQARLAFQHALQYRPAPATYAGAGDACAKLARYDEAVAFYTQALKLDPDVTLNYADLISALQAIGKVNEAAQVQARAEQIGYFAEAAEEEE